MLQSQAIEAYLKLSDRITRIEDPGLFMATLLPNILTTLNSLGYTFDCIEYRVLFDEKVSFFYDPEINRNVIIDFYLINNTAFEQNSEIDRELLWGKVIISSNILDLVNPNCTKKGVIRSVVLSPILGTSGLYFCLTLGTKRAASEISGDEIEFIQLVTQLTNFSYKISKGEISLTHVTQEVYKMNTELHKVNKLKDDFVSIASHELRTPMTAIRSYVWMALHRPDVALTKRMIHYLQRTLISTERLINLVNDMLNVSRIESGRIEIFPESFDLKQLVGEVLIEVDAKAKEKDLHFNHLEPKIPNVFADANKVHQILLNLIGNALKFTPEHGVISISYFTDGKTIEVAVKDTGTGISQEDIGRLFKKFSRLDNSYVAASSTGGTGLGLYICKSLLDLMKGRIWVASEGMGKGSTFSFSLPVATVELIKEAEKYHYTPQEGEAKLLEPVAIQAYPNQPE